MASRKIKKAAFGVGKDCLVLLRFLNAGLKKDLAKNSFKLKM